MRRVVSSMKLGFSLPVANSARILGADAPPMTGGVGASKDAIRAVTPAGRRGTLAEVAAAAVYLASEGPPTSPARRS